MVLQGETIGTGAPSRCPDCNTEPDMEVCRSAAGYYIGTMCDCGPYSRESGYYRTREEAKMALDAGFYNRM